MTRSDRPDRRLRALAAASLVVTIVTGCSAARPPLRTAYAPGEHAVTRDEVTLELTAVAFDDRTVSVAISLRNRGDLAVHVAHEGIVLRYEELEYPLDPGPAAGPDPIALASGAAAQLEFRFVLGPPPLHDGTLLLRSARAGERWLEGLRLRVPGPPPLPGRATPG